MVIELRQHEDFEHLLQRSESDPVLVFKHSTQCPISADAYEEFQRLASRAEDVTYGLVFVIENRPISSVIESKLGVRHQSPQAIVVLNRRPIWTASHYSITEQAMLEGLRART